MDFLRYIKMSGLSLSLLVALTFPMDAFGSDYEGQEEDKHNGKIFFYKAPLAPSAAKAKVVLVHKMQKMLSDRFRHGANDELLGGVNNDNNAAPQLIIPAQNNNVAPQEHPAHRLNYTTAIGEIWVKQDRNGHLFECVRMLPDGRFQPPEPYFNPGEWERGTATHIGNGCLISAAHVFEYLFPMSLDQRAGPVEIDLHGAEINWFYKTDENKNSKKIKVVKLVVEAEFIHLSNERNALNVNKSPEDRHWHPLAAIKRDIAFLLLDPSMLEGIPLIPLLEAGGSPEGSVSSFGKHCVVFGQGVPTHAEQPPLGIVFPGHANTHHIIHQFKPNEKIDDWDIIGLTPNDKLSDGNSTQAQVKSLICKSSLNNWYDRDAYGTQPGDSGGPLVVKTPKGKRIAGVTHGIMKNVPLNITVSLISGDSTNGYSLSPNVLALLNHLRNGM